MQHIVRGFDATSIDLKYDTYKRSLSASFA